MSDSPDDTKKGATEINAGANRRDFIKSAAAAGLVGAAGLTPALGQSTAAAPQGGAQDFITGWLAPGETKKGRWMGRPVGIVIGNDGAMYISDDTAGMIFRVTYAK